MPTVFETRQIPTWVLVDEAAISNDATAGARTARFEFVKGLAREKRHRFIDEFAQWLHAEVVSVVERDRGDVAVVGFDAAAVEKLDKLTSPVRIVDEGKEAGRVTRYAFRSTIFVGKADLPTTMGDLRRRIVARLTALAPSTRLVHLGVGSIDFNGRAMPNGMWFAHVEQSNFDHFVLETAAGEQLRFQMPSRHDDKDAEKQRKKNARRRQRRRNEKLQRDKDQPAPLARPEVVSATASADTGPQASLPNRRTPAVPRRGRSAAAQPLSSSSSPIGLEVPAAESSSPPMAQAAKRNKMTFAQAVTFMGRGLHVDPGDISLV